MDRETVEGFAELHEGGHVALLVEKDKDFIRPADQIAKGDSYVEAIEKHLTGDVPIGVYPLWERNNVWLVNWSAVDLDEGEKSDVHADNLQKVLSQMGIVSWKEPSRSKGYHVWVYLKEPISAKIAKEGLIGACRVVDVPIREVYPKQVSLEEGKIGNCLRLPYPSIRKSPRQEVAGYKCEDFVREALANRTPPAVYRKLKKLHSATEPDKPKVFVHGPRVDGQFYGVAKRIWERREEERDRSEAMYAFASSLLWQDYSFEATVDWVRRLDDRLEKFTGRADRDKQIRNLVTKASERSRRG